MSSFVSVIIPTYRGEETLERAIESVLGQIGFQSYEVLVIDDNIPESPHRKATEQVMTKYNDNSVIKYIKHSSNMNGAAARNTGFKHSKGDLICFLDDDDAFMPEKLKRQVDYMDEHTEFGASYTWRYQNSKDIIRYSKTGNLEREILLLKFFPTTITLMIRRSIYEQLNGFDESFNRHQDFEFLLRMFRICNIGVVCEPLSIIIGKNAGTATNILSGDSFYDLKIKFLDTFSCDIERIDSTNRGFKKKVYATHFAEVFLSDIAQKEFSLAKKHFKSGAREYGAYYCWRIVSHYISHVTKRIKRLFSSFQ